MSDFNHTSRTFSLPGLFQIRNALLIAALGFFAILGDHLPVVLLDVLEAFRKLFLSLFEGILYAFIT